MKQKALNNVQLQSFATGNNSVNDMTFDFSRINKKFYHQIVNALKKYSINHIQSLGFSLDLYYESYKSEFPTFKPERITKIVRSAKPKTEPTILAESCFRKIPQVIDNLLLAIDFILKNTKTLDSLTLRSFQLSKSQIEMLSQSLESNSTIKKLKLDNCTIFDEGFSTIIRSLHHEGLKTFICNNCGLTDISIEDIKSYLSYQVSLQREAEWKASLEIDGIVSTICLTTLNLQSNHFSIRLLMEIADILADLPLTLLDIRNNQQMDERIVLNIRKNIPHVAIRTKIISQRRGSKRKKAVKKKEDFEEEESRNSQVQIDAAAEPEANDVLEIPTFRFSRAPSVNSMSSAKSEEILLTNGLKVAGKRAAEFSQYIHDLCNFADEIMRTQNYQLPSAKSKRRSRSVVKRKRKMSNSITLK